MTLTTTNKTATPTIRKRTNMMIFMMTSILIYHRLSSIITYHHLSSSIITYHHLSSPIITYHHLSSIIYHLSSIIYHLSSIIYHLSSIIYHLSSIINDIILTANKNPRTCIAGCTILQMYSGFYEVNLLPLLANWMGFFLEAHGGTLGFGSQVDNESSTLQPVNKDRGCLPLSCGKSCNVPMRDLL